MASTAPKSIPEHRSAVQKYYSTLESKLGYRLVLSDTRHFGYYDSEWSFPLFVNRALRRMEEKLYAALDLAPGAQVLDAGCGFGHVALFMANKGLHVTGIDIVKRHIRHASTQVAKARPGSLRVQECDYHDLGAFADRSFDGVYTVETVVHATDPLRVFRNFARVLKPGGTLVMHEYDHAEASKVPAHIQRMNDKVHEYAATPGYTMFDYGVIENLLAQAGFVDIEVRDFTKNVMPMIWLFYLLAVVPMFFIQLFGQEHRFINAFSGVGFYKGRHWFRYVQVKARAPQQ